jgi:hypothetical protein
MSYDDFVDDPEWEAKYRWCVYCKADCWVDDPEHTTECPTSTGVFPIREGDKDMLCCRCKAPLSDSYMHIDMETGEVGPTNSRAVPVLEVVCIACAGRQALEADLSA